MPLLTIRRLRPAVILAALLAILASRPINAQAPPDKPFQFGKIDLQLLDESNGIDRRFEARGLVYHDAALEKHLADICGPLLPKQPLEHVQWAVRIARDPMVNAFALPNGSIYLNSGLISVAENDDQLAAVLSHEIIHVAKRHTYLFNRSLRKRTVALEIALSSTGLAPAGSLWAGTVLAIQGVSMLAANLSAYGYSRELEEEADLKGLEAFAGSGRDRAQMVRFFEVVDHRTEPEPEPFFWRSHPKIQRRIEYVKKAVGFKGEAPVARDAAYPVRVRQLMLQNIRLDLESRRFRSAGTAAQRLLDSRPGDAEAMFWLGESFRRLGPRKPALEPADLDPWTQRSAYNNMMKQTEQEETERLLKTPEGRDRQNANQRKAEELYLRAATLDPTLAKPQLGLGLLYEEQDKRGQALDAYAKYLALAPDAADRERVERRIAGLNAKGGPR